jgi:hypothetical protein
MKDVSAVGGAAFTAALGTLFSFFCFNSHIS